MFPNNNISNDIKMLLILIEKLDRGMDLGWSVCCTRFQQIAPKLYLANAK